MRDETNGESNRVLLVRGSDSSARSIATLLKKAGFQVVHSETLALATERVVQERFAVAVLADDGGQSLEAIRRQSPATRVVIHTTCGSMKSAKQAVNFGAFAYVDRDDERELIEHVRRAADDHRVELQREHEQHAKVQELECQVSVLESLTMEGAGNISGFDCFPPEGGKSLPAATNASVVVDDIRRQKKALHQRERRMHLVFAELEMIYRAVPVGLSLVDTDLRVVRVNDVLAAINGRSAKSHIGRPLREVLPTIADRVEPIYRRVIESGVPELNVEVTRPQVDDPTDVRSLLIDYYPLQDDTGVVIAVSTIVQDVTRRKQSEQELVASEARFRAIVVNSYDVIKLFSAQGEALYASPSIKRVLGYEPDELIGRPGIEIVHPDDRKDALNGFSAALQKPRVTVQLVHRLRHKDGSYRKVEATGTNLLNEPGVNAMVSIFRDVTDREHMAAELRESESKFRVLSERCPAMVGIFQGQRFRYANPAVLATTGYSHEELTQMDFLELIHPESRNEVRDRSLRRQNGEPVPARYEFRYLTKSKEERWLDFSAESIEFDGEPSVLAVGIDVTERKAAEEKLREKEKQLAHVSRLRTMGEMVAGIAHEINQPLSAIANFADACTKALGPLERDKAVPLERWTREISQQAVRCGDIIRRLRDFVKTDPADRASVDLNEVVRDSVALIRSDIRLESISVECEPIDPCWCVYANKVELEQVLVNLLRNACEAMKDGATNDRRVFVSTRASAECAEIAVRDHGPGIDEASRDKIFDAFFTTKSDGLGMGLAISRSIVEKHGGRLWAESRTSGGAVFHIELPLAR